MTPGSMFTALVLALTVALITIALRRQTPPHPHDPLIGGDPVTAEGDGWRHGDDRARRDAPLAATFSASDVLAVEHLRGKDAVEALVARLWRVVEAAERSGWRRPRPASILLHGPPGGAMTMVAHELARAARARLVQVYATRALPNTNGSAQPRIAAAVNEARDRLPSILVIDELELVGAPSVRDPERMRTASDLLAAALRPLYSGRHVVVGLYTDAGDDPVPRQVAEAFEHVEAVDLPQLERALSASIVRTGDGTLLRAIAGKCLVECADLAPSHHSAA